MERGVDKTMSTDHEYDGCRACLSRLWRAGTKGRWHWRVPVENPGSGERYRCRTLTELFTFLKGNTHEETPRSGVDGQDVERGSVPYAEEERDDV